MERRANSPPLAEKKNPSVATAIHSIDFSANDEAAYAQMFSSLKALDIGVLGVCLSFIELPKLIDVTVSQQCREIP